MSEVKEEETRIVGPYRLGRKLGEGHFAKVQLGEDQFKHKAAIKVFNKEQISKSPHYSFRHVERELNALRLCSTHPNIAALTEVLETSTDVYCVMEYVPAGELYDYIVSEGKLGEEEGARLFYQIASAVQFCHARGIAHRDLKPENILLDSKLNAKIVDFGLASPQGVVADSEGNFAPPVLRTQCGSPEYAAPEVLQATKGPNSKGYLGAPADVWSLGVVLYAMICGTLPFTAPSIPLIVKNILKGQFVLPEHLSVESRLLLTHMLTVDPAQRPTMGQVLTHPWLRCRPLPHVAIEVAANQMVALAKAKLVGFELEDPQAAPPGCTCNTIRLNTLPPKSALVDGSGSGSGSKMDHEPECPLYETAKRDPADTYLSMSMRTPARSFDPVQARIRGHTMQLSEYGDPNDAGVNLDEPIEDFEEEEEEEDEERAQQQQLRMAKPGPAAAAAASSSSSSASSSSSSSSSATSAGAPAKSNNSNSKFAIKSREMVVLEQALFKAAEAGDVTAIKKMVADNPGLDLRARGIDNWTALHFAARKGHAGAVEALLTSLRPLDIDAVTKTNWTALMMAADQGHADAVSILVKFGANIHLASSTGKTAIFMARESKHNHIATMLTEASSQRTRHGRQRPLQVQFFRAAEQGDLNLMRHILKLSKQLQMEGDGAPRRKSKKGSPLKKDKEPASASKPNPAYVVSIAGKGIDNWTALHYAARKGHVAVVQALVSSVKPEEVNCVTKANWTPLMMAADQGNYDICRILLRHGAPVEMKNSQGHSAAELARMKKFDDLAEMLSHNVAKKR